ncbi:MAG: hypothetical protein IVW51_04985 [Thermaceae bacterium]|nr:hypothetical protein [Thermaceae bacterium]
MKPKRQRSNKRQAGIALVTVLIAGVIAIAILTILNISVLGELRSGRSVGSRNQLAQAADGVSDQARLQLLLDYTNSKKTIPNYLSYLSSNLSTTPLGGKIDLGQGLKASWKVTNVSQPTDKYGWVEIHATAYNGNSNQTVIRRVSFGQNPIFDLAMLSETINCMYCHLRVNGDVGSLQFFRPGWGTEGNSGQGSGGADGGSNINGNVFIAPCPAGTTCPGTNNLTNDSTDLSGTPKLINGAQVTQAVNTNYTGSKLPKSTNGVPQFPPIERAVGEANADGTMSGGLIVGVPKGGQLTALPSSSNVPQVSGVYNGNLVLIGTAANPIVLKGDIYVKGDVVIKGVVTGRGAIYSDRNTYIAGNVTTVNPPDSVGTGVCTGITNPDTCAQKNVAAGKDELRLATRGSTIMGDYTERNATGTKLPYDQTQSADYYRSQFGFYSGNRYYDTVTGDELYKGTDGKYYNVENQQISSTQVITKAADPGSNTSANPNDAYSYSFRPGSINSSGGFTPWLSDAFYKNQLLGQQSFTYNTWRTGLPGRNSGESDKAFITRITNALVAARLPKSEASAIAQRYVNGDGAWGQDFSGGHWYFDGGNTLRVIIDNKQSYPAQVTQVDAFLYSNWRIAGKTSMQALAVNGGMIAKQLGVLAPGRKVETWWTDTLGNWDGWSGKYDFLNDPKQAQCASGQTYYVPGTNDCALTVNYDYRLRNGGFGYDLVKGTPGQTIAWRLSGNTADRVAP